MSLYYELERIREDAVVTYLLNQQGPRNIETNLNEDIRCDTV